MTDRMVLRYGGAAAMIGAVVGLVFNLLHPRPEEASVAGEIEMIAGSDIWLFDHYMLAWSLAFTLVGLLAIGWSFPIGAAATWSRLAAASAIGGIAIGFATVLVDGAAAKEAADNAVAGGAAAVATAEAVVHVGLALFTGLMGSLFGLTPVLFGLAGLATDAYPKWLAWLALAAGAIGFLSGSIQYLGGISVLTAGVLFPISSLAFTVWGFTMGWQIWKQHSAPAPTTEAKAAVAA